jgi:hypothetical protein
MRSKISDEYPYFPMQHPERLIRHAIRTAKVSGAKAVKYLLNRPTRAPPGTAGLVIRMIVNLKNLSKGTEDRVPYSGSNSKIYLERGDIRGHSAARRDEMGLSIAERE